MIYPTIELFLAPSANPLSIPPSIPPEQQLPVLFTFVLPIISTPVPSSVPEGDYYHPTFHYYNKKEHTIVSYFNKHNKHNNTQNFSPLPNPFPVRSWYRKYHPISTLCEDYDNFIFQSIQHWSFTKTRDELHYIETFDVSSISSFVDSFDVLKHYKSLQHLHTATIPPHYKSQPTASPLYQRILLEARDLQNSLNQYNTDDTLPLQSTPLVITMSFPLLLILVLLCLSPQNCQILPLLLSLLLPNP